MSIECGAEYPNGDGPRSGGSAETPPQLYRSVLSDRCIPMSFGNGMPECYICKLGSVAGTPQA